MVEISLDTIIDHVGVSIEELEINLRTPKPSRLYESTLSFLTDVYDNLRNSKSLPKNAREVAKKTYIKIHETYNKWDKIIMDEGVELKNKATPGVVVNAESQMKLYLQWALARVSLDPEYKNEMYGAIVEAQKRLIEMKVIVGK